MNNIDFNQDGGFRLSTNVLAAVQASYSLFNALGWIGGNLTIISGCEVTGSSVSDGVVFINGEVFNFKGGNIGTNVIIRENITSYPFQNGTVKPVIRERYVSFGSGTPDQNFLWADFKRLFPTKDIQEFKDNHNNRITALEGRQAFVVGMIIRFDQPLVVLPPAGWEDHNPIDEQGRIWIGRSTSDSDFGLGNKMGSKTQTLTKQQLPNVRIPLFAGSTINNENYPINANEQVRRGTNSGGDGAYNLQRTTDEATVGLSAPLGSGQSFSIMPPVVVVRYIKYIGL